MSVRTNTNKQIEQIEGILLSSNRSKEMLQASAKLQAAQNAACGGA